MMKYFLFNNKIEGMDSKILLRVIKFRGAGLKAALKSGKKISIWVMDFILFLPSRLTLRYLFLLTFLMK